MEAWETENYVDGTNSYTAGRTGADIMNYREKYAKKS